MVLERNQLINITMQEVDGHLSFDVLDIPHELLTIAHELLIEKLQTEHQPGEHPFRIVYSNDFAARKEVFDLLRFTLSQEKGIFENEEKENIATYALLLLLSGFIHDTAFAGIISRSAKLSVKYKVYNLLYTEPDKQWKLDDVSSAIFMSASTLKKKTGYRRDDIQ